MLHCISEENDAYFKGFTVHNPYIDVHKYQN